MARKTFYVTTPIYYPSASLHLGHAYTTTLAWVLRNYKRACGYDAIMLTGADEHGQKIESIARQQQVPPQVYVDKMNTKFLNFWQKLAIDFDLYSRTTTPSHQQAVQKQFTHLLRNNEIFLGKYKGLYSIQDEEFLTAVQAKRKNGKFWHPLSGHELKEISEESYFFKMSKYKDWLQTYFRNHPRFIIPSKITKELDNNFLSAGLEDLSVSRTSFTWGIPILENKKHIIYVWLDALNNYITTLGYNQDDNRAFQKYWVNGDEVVHIVGKEITRFHCIYWPVLLKASRLRQPTHIFSHGWLITPEGKMSKSKGNVINPLELVSTYGAEQLKYYLSSQIRHGQDGVFELEAFVNVINTDLANNIGNLVSRTVAMIQQSFPNLATAKPSAELEDKEIRNAIQTHFQAYRNHFDQLAIDHALQEAISLSRKINLYIDRTAPWMLKNNLERLAQIFSHLLNGIYAVATMLMVVVPQAMEKVQQQIGVKAFRFALVLDFEKFTTFHVEKGDIIFQRYKPGYKNLKT